MTNQTTATGQKSAARMTAPAGAIGGRPQGGMGGRPGAGIGMPTEKSLMTKAV